MQFRSRHVENEIEEGGELLRPFGPRQIPFQFGCVVGPLDMPFCKNRLEIGSGHASQLRRLANGQQSARVKSERDLLADFGLSIRSRQAHSINNFVRYFQRHQHANKIAASADEGKPLYEETALHSALN